MKLPVFLACLLLSPGAFARIEKISLPTAENGTIDYEFDTDTRQPLSAHDDRAGINAVALELRPKKPGEETMTWGWRYEVLFLATAPAPVSIVVYSENHAPVFIVASDPAPVLKDRVWSAPSSISAPMDKRAFTAWTSTDPWFVQNKFVITYADGSVRVLHQLAVITNPMRFDLIEKALGKKISEPVK